jgi:chorismate mutase
MALSDDQRALLRLLAQREEGYEDIAALKGLSVGQVRAEVKDALAELQAAAEAPPPPPPPRVEEPPPLPPEPPKRETRDPEPPASPPKEEPQRQARPAARPQRPALPAERRRFVLLAGGALGIVAVVLIAIAVIGGSSDSGSNSTEVSGSGTELTAAESEKVTQAVLEPADGSDASGSAVFGRIGKAEVVLQVTAENLEPTESGQSYTVWLYRSPKLSLRVGSVPVGEEGRLGARFAIPAELLAYVASGAFDQIYVSRTEDAAYQREVARAKRDKGLPRYIGETVLTGEITGPIAKAGSSNGG